MIIIIPNIKTKTEIAYHYDIKFKRTKSFIQLTLKLSHNNLDWPNVLICCF